MTKRELEKILKENGWKIKHGTKHDAAVKDDTGTKIMLPRHKGDYPNSTAKAILKEAGII